MSLNIVQQFMKGMVKICFGLLKIQVKFLKKIKSRGFLASSLSTYDSPSLYTTLPHNLIKEKLTGLIEHSCNNKIAFLFLFEQPRRYKLWSCQKMCDALHYLLSQYIYKIWLEII